MKVIVLILTLVLIASVTAAGSSTWKPEPPPPAPPQVVPQEPTLPDCETLPLQGRIQCRLEQNIEKDGIPEACTAAPSSAACAQLYNNVYPCYDVSGPERDACFTSISDDPYNYVQFLLYDLQERVEHAYEDNTLSAQQAATRITLIVEAKHAVFQKNIAKTQQKVRQLKTLWEDLP